MINAVKLLILIHQLINSIDGGSRNTGVQVTEGQIEGHVVTIILVST
jgi:hypothetical protein